MRAETLYDGTGEKKNVTVDVGDISTVYGIIAVSLLRNSKTVTQACFFPVLGRAGLSLNQGGLFPQIDFESNPNNPAAVMRVKTTETTVNATTDTKDSVYALIALRA